MVDGYCFPNETNGIPVYVPKKSVEDYKKAAGWNNFTNIQANPGTNASGTCGYDLTWNLSFGELTISGTGPMNNYSHPFDTENQTPWKDYRASIVTIIIGSGVTTIGENAFFGCDAVTDVTLPSSLETIGLSAFEDCKILPSVTIPNSVENIGYKAFATVLNVAYSGTVTGAPWGARSLNGYVDGNLIYSSSSKTNLRVCSSAVKGEVTLPATLTGISAAAFSGCANVTTVVIPDGVTSIDDYTFYGCKGMTSITLPAGIQTIGDYAFFNCEGLTSITCDAVTPPNWTGGSSTTFKHVNMSIPVYVPYKSVAAYKANEDWNQFTNIQACLIASGTCGASGDNLTWELSCDSVLYISGIGDMKDYDYFSSDKTPWDPYGSKIRSVEISSGVTSIGDYAFTDYANLTSVTIPYGVTKIGISAFYSCPLTSVEIPDGVTSIEPYTFEFCQDLTSVTLGEGITSIDKEAFRGCDKLTSITIPNSVLSIGEIAFAGCTALTELNIGGSVTSIGLQAFVNCSALKSITCEAATPPTCYGSSCFYGVNHTIPLYVPKGSVDAYKSESAAEWKDFTNIMAIGSGQVPYELVDLSKESLTEDQYIIVFDDNKAHAAVSGKDLIASSDELTFDGNLAYAPKATACAVTITPLGTDGFSILLADGTSYLNQTEKNSVTTSPTAVKFAITDGDEGDQTVAISKYLASESKTYTLRHNNSEDKFRMYYSTGAQYTLPKLYRKKETATGIDQVNSQEPSAKSQKMFRNGQLFILRDGKTYNALGVEVK